MRACHHPVTASWATRRRRADAGGTREVAGLGTLGAMARTGTSTVSFEEAVDATRTGDLWIFRGGTVADRLIQTASNAPVNHVGMAVVLDDLPPLMWHAELGRSMRDHWTGDHHRGVQLHDLREAVTTWQGRYGQRAWLRQITPDVGREQEDAAAAHHRPARTGCRSRAPWGSPGAGCAVATATCRTARGRAQGAAARGRLLRRGGRGDAGGDGRAARPTRRRTGTTPGRFWSGDTLPLRPGWSYGVEVEVARASR